MMGYAMCCRTPLVSTCLFMKAEWYCVKCGGTYGFLGVPQRADPTPELEKKHKKNDEIFRQFAEKAVPRNCYVKSCDQCNPEYHHEHMTDEEKADSDSAFKKLFAGDLAGGDAT